MKPACTTEERVFPFYSVGQTVRFEYKKPRGGRQAFTEIKPSVDGKLTLDITRSFPKLGTHREVFHFPDNELLEKVCATRTLGWPPALYYLSRTFSPLIRWPHHRSVLWPQEYSSEDLLRAIVWHAALDTLGALSLLCRNGYFVANVVSECSGHEGDVGAVLLADKHVVFIG